MFGRTVTRLTLTTETMSLRLATLGTIGRAGFHFDQVQSEVSLIRHHYCSTVSEDVRLNIVMLEHNDAQLTAMYY